MEDLSDLVSVLREIEDSEEPVSRIRLAKFFYDKKLYKLAIRELIELRGQTNSVDKLVDSAILLLGGAISSSADLNVTDANSADSNKTKIVAEIKVS